MGNLQPTPFNSFKRLVIQCVVDVDTNNAGSQSNVCSHLMHSAVFVANPSENRDDWVMTSGRGDASNGTACSCETKDDVIGQPKAAISVR